MFRFQINKRKANQYINIDIVTSEKNLQLDIITCIGRFKQKLNYHQCVYEKGGLLLISVTITQLHVLRFNISSNKSFS
ncbi:MAG: hypothetical protein UZ11_BCD004000243 [Bacteroidetes bacterium OLB11]|nr:MAG: hypothetical protein UZ11_BCD004000243 [Bacteroidetes bacterium OLB11]